MAALFSDVKDTFLNLGSYILGSSEAAEKTEYTSPMNQEMHTQAKNCDTIQDIGLPTWLLTGKSITQHPSYHGSLRGKEAESKLRQQRENCYLTRVSRRNKLFLSVLRARSGDFPILRHFKIGTTHENGITMYEIEGTENEFNDVFKLLEFYQNEPISLEIDGIGSAVKADGAIADTESSESSQTDDADYHHTTTIEEICDQNPYFSDVEITQDREGQSKLPHKSRDDIKLDYRSSPHQGLPSDTPTKPKRRATTVRYQRNSRGYRKTIEDLVNPHWKLTSIDQHPSYHGAMTGVEAEDLLMQHGSNCYLTRYSKSRRMYTLSVRSEARVYHFSLNIAGKDKCIYEVKGSGKSFESGFEMLQYYQNNPVSIAVNNIGEPLKSTDLLDTQQSNTSNEDEKQNEASVTSISSSPEDKDEEVVREKLMRPSLHNLTLIKWVDAQGQKRKLKILEKIGTKWQTVGILLGQTMPVLESYRRMAANDIQCCRHVFYQWLENNNHSDYPLNWEGVYTLLHDADHSSAAEDLKKALASKGIPLV